MNSNRQKNKVPRHCIIDVNAASEFCGRISLVLLFTLFVSTKCSYNIKKSFEFFTADCACPAKISTSWFNTRPFIYEHNGNVSGIFPKLLKEIVDTCCGNCSAGHGVSNVEYGRPKKSLLQVKNSLSSDEVFHLTFPIAGKETDDEYKVREGVYRDRTKQDVIL